MKAFRAHRISTQSFQLPFQTFRTEPFLSSSSANVRFKAAEQSKAPHCRYCALFMPGRERKHITVSQSLTAATTHKDKPVLTAAAVGCCVMSVAPASRITVSQARLLLCALQWLRCCTTVATAATMMHQQQQQQSTFVHSSCWHQTAP
eukprot:12287-Heterococcus_DN1.PRE.2